MSFCVQGLQLLKKPKNQISFHRHFSRLNKGKRKCKWLGFVKSTLEKLGFSEIWQSQQFPNAGWLYWSIKRRLQDQFIQEQN